MSGEIFSKGIYNEHNITQLLTCLESSWQTKNYESLH